MLYQLCEYISLPGRSMCMNADAAVLLSEALTHLLLEGMHPLPHAPCMSSTGAPPRRGASPIHTYTL